MNVDNLRQEVLDYAEKSGTKKQHEKGKLTARERITRLFDEGTFQEIGMFVTHRCTQFGMQEKVIAGDGVITGAGMVNGRIVYAAFQDFRASGGTLGEMHAKKICNVLKAAINCGAPFVFVADSGGARIQEGVDSLAGFGDIFYLNTKASGVIPQISAILGPCAGGAVYSPALTDFIFTVNNVSKMFITGPSVVKEVSGAEVDSESLGGAKMHSSVSGVANFISENEDDCFAMIRELLNIIPHNNFEIENKKKYKGIEMSGSISDVLPSDFNTAYDVKNIISLIADNGSYFEVSSHFAENMFTGFIYIDGRRIAVVANNPAFKAGSIDINASVKAARFVRFADSFNIPILTLVDTPGYMPGLEEERGGIIRHGAKLLYAYSEANVAKVTLVLRKAFGGAYIAMCSKHLGADMVYAYENAQIAVLGAQAAYDIICASSLKGDKDEQSKKRTFIEDYNKNVMNVLQAANRGYVDDIIKPIETKAALSSAFSLFDSKKTYKIEKKHGNIPL